MENKKTKFALLAVVAIIVIGITLLLAVPGSPLAKYTWYKMSSAASGQCMGAHVPCGALNASACTAHGCKLMNNTCTGIQHNCTSLTQAQCRLIPEMSLGCRWQTQPNVVNTTPILPYKRTQTFQ